MQIRGEAVLSIPEMGNSWCQGPEAVESGVFRPSEEGDEAGKSGRKVFGLAGEEGFILC